MLNRIRYLVFNYFLSLDILIHKGDERIVGSENT